MLVKKRLYFDNGNCYLDFSWHTIDQEIDIFRPSTSLKEFFSMSYKYEELQDDEILSQLQEIDKTIKQLKVLKNDNCNQSDIDHWKRCKAIDQNQSDGHFNAIKAELFFKMQCLTNVYAHRHGATNEEIEAISYYDYDTIEFKNIANKALDELNQMTITMINQPYLSITYDIIRCWANYDPNSQSREVWNKLLREGKIPNNGLCNALNESYQTKAYDFVCDKYDICQKNEIGNLIDKIIYNILANKQTRGYQTAICHVMIAAFLCGYIQTLRNLINIVSRRYGCKLNPNQWSRTLMAFWCDVCDHGKSNRKFRTPTNHTKNFYISEIEELFLYYIAHNNFDFIATLIPDNKPYYVFFNQFRKLMINEL